MILIFFFFFSPKELRAKTKQKLSCCMAGFMVQINPGYIFLFMKYSIVQGLIDNFVGFPLLLLVLILDASFLTFESKVCMSCLDAHEQQVI